MGEDYAQFQMSSKRFKHDKNLFVKNNKPIVFSMRSCEARAEIAPYITHGGGVITGKLSSDSIRLLEPGSKVLNRDNISVPLQYIWDCIDKNELLNIDDYKNDPTEVSDIELDDDSIMVNIRVKARNCRTRQDYSVSDELKLIEFISKHNRHAEVKGTKLWKAMENLKVLTRTWQSMKEHFLKKIIPKIARFNLSKEEIKKFRKPFCNEMKNFWPESDNSANEESEAEDIRMDEEASECSSADHNTSKQSVGAFMRDNRYSMSDDMRILKYILDREIRISQIKGTTIWKEMAIRKITHRTWQSMKNRFLKNILPNIEEYSIPSQYERTLAMLKRRYGYNDSKNSSAIKNNSVRTQKVKKGLKAWLAESSFTNNLDSEDSKDPDEASDVVASPVQTAVLSKNSVSKIKPTRRRRISTEDEIQVVHDETENRVSHSKKTLLPQNSKVKYSKFPEIEFSNDITSRKNKRTLEKDKPDSAASGSSDSSERFKRASKRPDDKVCETRSRDRLTKKGNVNADSDETDSEVFSTATQGLEKNNKHLLNSRERAISDFYHKQVEANEIPSSLPFIVNVESLQSELELNPITRGRGDIQNFNTRNMNCDELRVDNVPQCEQKSDEDVPSKPDDNAKENMNCLISPSGMQNIKPVRSDSQKEECRVTDDEMILDIQAKTSSNNEKVKKRKKVLNPRERLLLKHSKKMLISLENEIDNVSLSSDSTDDSASDATQHYESDNDTEAAKISDDDDCEEDTKISDDDCEENAKVSENDCGNNEKIGDNEHEDSENVNENDCEENVKIGDNDCDKNGDEFLMYLLEEFMFLPMNSSYLTQGEIGDSLKVAQKLMGLSASELKCILSKYKGNIKKLLENLK